MPLKLPREDRKLVIGLGALFACTVALVVFMAETDPGYGMVPSSFGTGSSGAKVAYMLLEQTGYKPQRWTRRPEQLKQFPAGTTLILAEASPGEQRDIKAVREFLSNGGRVVGTGVGIASIIGGANIKAGVPHYEWKAYHPAEPSSITRAIREIVMAPKFFFLESAGNIEFRDADEIAVIRVPYGKGEVIWWASSEPLTNSGISQKDNAQLLLNSVGTRGDKPVLWDEYFHEDAKTVIDSIWESPLKWALLQCALIGMVVCFTWSRRFGPVRAAATRSRLAPMEFVETLAGLYQRAKAGNVAVEIVYERFRTALKRRYGIRRETSPIEVAQLLGSSAPEGMQALLEEAESSIHHPEIKAGAAREIVVKLHAAAQQLKLKI
jgi:hypothetical protein